MDNLSNKSYDMNFRRAIKLMRMPEDWFNTQEKAELRSRAISFLNSNPEFSATAEAIRTGKVTDADRLEAKKKSKAAYDTALEGNTNLQEAENAILEEDKNHDIVREIFELDHSLTGSFIDYLYLQKGDLFFAGTGGRPVIEEYKERLTNRIKQMKEEKAKEDKRIKNRISKFFKRITGKKIEPDQEEILIGKNEMLLGRIDEFISKKQYIDKVHAACDEIGYADLHRKLEQYHTAIRNFIHQLGYDEQELYAEQLEKWNGWTDKARAEVEGRFDSIASAVYYDLPTKDKFEARDTKNISNYRSSEPKKDIFEDEGR